MHLPMLSKSQHHRTDQDNLRPFRSGSLLTEKLAVSMGDAWQPSAPHLFQLCWQASRALLIVKATMTLWTEVSAEAPAGGWGKLNR